MVSFQVVGKGFVFEFAISLQLIRNMDKQAEEEGKYLNNSGEDIGKRDEDEVVQGSWVCHLRCHQV